MNKNVQLHVNGQIYTGWTEVELVDAIEAICGSFSFKAINASGKNEKFLPITTGMPCSITYGGKLLLTGYIDDCDPDLHPDDVSITTITGRSKTCDLVDCGIESFSSFKNASLETIIRKLCKPFGIDLKVEVETGKVFSEFKIQPGETVFEAMDRACRLRGHIIVCDNSGTLVIGEIGKNRIPVSLKEGVNIYKASLKRSVKERFSKYIVTGQDLANDSIFAKSATAIRHSVVDPLIPRYRPTVIVAESVVSKDTAKKRAEWECAIRRARSIGINCIVNGWSYDATLWEKNVTVLFQSETLGITGNSYYITSKVTKTYNELDGEMTDITLVPEGSFTVEPQSDISKKDKNPFALLPPAKK
jgi:prophage tail gpP-like protein